MMNPSLLTRRTTLTLAAAGAAGLAFGRSALAQTSGAGIEVRPVNHASLVLQAGETAVHVDPVGGAEPWADLPPARLIVVTHEHGDHFDLPTLEALMQPDTELVVNPAVHGMLPEALQTRARALANGESAEVAGVAIEAIPAYNITEDRLQYHPKGRDNGYVLTLDGKRVLIAGDTEDTDELRALQDIDLAFLPMNLPYTMTEEQAAAAVAAFRPAEVWPYHFKGSDPQKFADLVAASGASSTVVIGDWY